MGHKLIRQLHTLLRSYFYVFCVSNPTHPGPVPLHLRGQENYVGEMIPPYRRIEEKTGRFAPAGMEVAILSIFTGSDEEPATIERKQ